MQNSQTKTTRARILAGIGAIAVVVLSLILFINVNTARITEQNENYLQDSTEASARRVNDLLERSLDIVQTAAAIYEVNVSPENMSSPENIAAELKLTSFDYSFFVTVDGYGYRDSDKKKAIVTDKAYYTEGMKGNSGIVALPRGAFSDKNVLVFYSPVIYDGVVHGIFCGAYREDTLSDYYMKTAYFGVETPTYLIAPDGLIVARSVSCDDDPKTIQELLDNSESSVAQNTIFSDLEKGASATFTYQADGHGGDTYITKLEDFDWTLMRSFPETITNTMVRNSSMAGFIPIGGVAIAAGIIMVLLALQARRQRDTLLLERQKADRIIDTSTELFHSVYTIDLETGDYEFLAPAHSMQDIFPDSGNIEDMIQSVSDLSEGEFKQSIRDNMAPSEIKKKLAKKEGAHPFYQFEQRLSNPDYDGDERWLQASILELERDEDGELKTVLATVQDVTDIKQKEIAQHHAIEEACRAAEYASKAKSDFLNNMSHDIRTPMNSIMGMTAIAAMHMDDTDRVRDCLDNIASASKHLLGLINEVLDMSKIESGNIALAEENFELPEMIESVTSIVLPQAEAKNQRLFIEVDDISHERVTGDSTRLQQVFVNILSNSVKFTDEGGEIRLKLKEIQSNVRGSATYQIVFEDTGCGMTPEFLETIFVPFARANDTRTTKVEGTGLGMAIVKSVVELMSGTISVESEVGVGTKITVIINLKINDEEITAGDFKGHVLVVDDDLATCQLTCDMLTELGMTAEYATGGQEAIDKVIAAETTGGCPFDTIIMDWKMPEMSGVEVTRIIRSKVEVKVPIVVFSGYDWSTIEEEAKTAGVNAFLMKPLFKSRLLRLLREFILGDDGNSLDQSAALESLGFADKKILLTEDNPMAAEIASEIIGMTGAEVVHAENGKIAYETLLASEPNEYDLVFMDIQMPIMNGYEAVKAIREAGNERADLAELPIIALSADAFADDIKRSQEAGMNEHMSKPLEIEPLIKTLNKWLANKDKDA